MKQVIGIYCGKRWFTNWDEHTVENGAGGSETWAVELASVFQKWGFHVIIFGQPSKNHFAENGVEYVKSDDFNRRCEYQHFDYFISSRTTEEINPGISCTNIYLMGHDTEIDLRYDTPVLKLDRIKKIMLLSEWQKKIYLANYSGLTEDRIVTTCNGVNQDLYRDVDNYKKENMMVWSSSPERGLTLFLTYFYPKIKEKIPDFKLKICGYNTFTDYPEIIDDGVEFVGKLSKKDLAELQKRSKVWIYPNNSRNDLGDFFHETFCITAVENALSKNAIVCFNSGGLSTTLEGYEHMYCKEYFNELDFIHNIEQCKEKMNEILLNKSLELLLNEEKRQQAAEYVYNKCQSYTWENCAMDWLKEWGLTYGK